MSRARPTLAAAAGLLAAAALGPASSAHAGWVASWEAAAAVLQQPSLRATTVRQVLRLSVGGTRLRLRFSNETGTRAMAIGDVHVALPGAAPGAIDPASDRPVTFGGASTVAVAPGAPLLSDPVDLPTAALSRVVVTAVLDGSSPRQVGHDVGGETAYLVAGDHAGETVLAGSRTSTARYALGGVEVEVPGVAVPAVGTLGDSITDGFGASVDGDRRWTDRLAERLAARTGAAVPAVVNGGIAGNALASTDDSVFGPSGLSRLDRDALNRVGLRWLVLFEGINDILNAADPRTAAAALIAADGEVIARAHARGIRVIGATLTPFRGTGRGMYSAPREAARQAVNAWIRTGGAFDAVVDFDAVLRDPGQPQRLLPAFDSGDHLHPGDAGYRAMGDAVPLGLFR